MKIISNENIIKQNALFALYSQETEKEELREGLQTDRQRAYI